VWRRDGIVAASESRQNNGEKSLITTITVSALLRLKRMTRPEPSWTLQFCVLETGSSQ
jgi:hypothetical protein